MVRVISVHHFSNQSVQTVEQPTACTTAPPNRLLLALMSNCIEVRDLKNDSQVLFTFPTVDEVSQIIHSINGDYVATLETKFNRQNKEINFVRIYINWNSVATWQQSKMTSSGVSLGSSECGMVQPMRARIAGRVTPTTNQTELGNLEMIEVPVTKNPHSIACCQVSGNLLILSNNLLNIYSFKVKTHDISKMRFIDFEDMGFTIELSFSPIRIDLCENYIACMNQDSMHIFTLTKKTNHDLNRTNENDLIFKYSQNGPIDFRKLVKEEALNISKEKVTVNLPSIVRENSIIHKHSPFTFSDKDMTAKLIVNSPLENKLFGYQIKNLIQLKLIPILVENAQRQVTEEFKSFILKPLYIDEKLNKSNNTLRCDNLLRSDFSKCLNSVTCMIATQQEGYLYHFNESESPIETDYCIAVYPFTAPVFQLVMEDYLLHALTETGLESYTLRSGHKLCRNIELVDNFNVACPPMSDSICLVGLRPFLGVEQILLAENYLVLLANADTSPTHSITSNSSSNAAYWTLYALEVPTPKMIFNDISIVASVHRFTSAQTYCHLMNEAHMVLRTSLTFKQWTATEENVRLICPYKSNVDDVVEVYKNSCALLADHFIMCSNRNDFPLAIPYYKMARTHPFEVLRRIKKIQEQSNNHFSRGLLHYLKNVVLEFKTGQEADKFFSSGSKQNFVDELLNLLENHGYEDLPGMILKSKILREYSTDKLINILTTKVSDEFPKQAEKHLALAILYIQKCNTTQAESSLELIALDNLYQILLETWELLFDSSCNQQQKTKTFAMFSELTDLLISYNPDMMSQLFVHLMLNKKVINLSRILKIFLEYLPSSIGFENNKSSVVLQKTIERYFREYFAKPENADQTKLIYEKGAHEAIKLLVRSYLSQLKILQMKDDNNKRISDQGSELDATVEELKATEEDKETYSKDSNYIQPVKPYFEEAYNRKSNPFYLFANLRYTYLDKMPPFQLEITSKLYQTCVENYPCRNDYPVNEEADLVLGKLQALLCSQVVSKHVTSEVNSFVSLNENLRGKDSLQSIILTNNDAILMLLETCPQCLLQFGKDRFSRTDEWKYLIASIQRKILRLSQQENLSRICFFYKKNLKDILLHVATSMTLDELIQVFPQRFSTTVEEYSNGQNDPPTNHAPGIRESDVLIENADDVAYSEIERDADILKEIQDYEPFIVICKETMHANQINKLITTTGQQLLSTLSL